MHPCEHRLATATRHISWKGISTIRATVSRYLTTSARLVSKRNAPAPTVYVDTGLVVAAVGRPNVGKSTLYNALAASVRGRGSEGVNNPTSFVFVKSVVDSTPGVTRDPRRTVASVGDLLFTIVDTPGLERPVSKRAILEADKLVNATPIETPPGPLPSVVSSAALCEDSYYRSLYDSMEAAAVRAVREAHIAMFVVDAGDGVTPLDQSISEWLREECSSKSDPLKQVMLVANKCDRADAEDGTNDAYRLGLGEPIAISGEHKLGFGDLYNYFNSMYHLKQSLEMDQTKPVFSMSSQFSSQREASKEAEKDWKPEIPTTIEEAEEDNPFDDELIVTSTEVKGEEPLKRLLVSIVGRPNVGKSSLLNRLVGEERSLVGPASGVTRDSVVCRWNPTSRNALREEVPTFLIDTAGMRSKPRVEEEPLEKLSVRSSIRALRHSHIALVVVDAEEPLTAQDVKLVELCIMEGRGIVLVVNKMDKVNPAEKDEWKKKLRENVETKLHSIPGVEIIEVCAADWTDGDVQSGRLFGAVSRARQRWETRIKTSALLRFLKKFNERAIVGGSAKVRRNRHGVAKFITQKKVRPPMFRIDGAQAVSKNYLRHLSKELRKEFGLPGVPIRIKTPTRR